jgi:hypothetical protein
MRLLLDHVVDANDRVSRCLEIDPAIYITIKKGHLASRLDDCCQSGRSAHGLDGETGGELSNRVDRDPVNI